MEKETIKKSDVGLKVFDKFKEVNSLMSKNEHYENITSRIRSRVDDIFRNYLLIGDMLLEVNKKKIYEYNEYKNIYEYAEKEFNLKTTTVKNVMSISKRFCDENGLLKEEFKAFSYSSLVELLSVDEKEIKKFKPTMTIAATRSKKMELEINEKIKDIFESEEYFTDLIQEVLSYDFTTNLGRKYNITYEIKKDFNKDAILDSTCGVYFTLKDSVKMHADIKFAIEIVFSKYYRKIRLTQKYSQWITFDISLEPGENLTDALDWFCNKYGRDDNVVYTKEHLKIKNIKKNSTPHWEIKDFEIDDEDFVGFSNIVSKVIKNKLKGFYYKGYNPFRIYKESLDDDKKNPKLCEVKDTFELKDLFIVQYDASGKEVSTFKIFESHFYEKIEKYIEERLNKIFDTIKEDNK